ncbi:MAG: hypothetical protein UH241_10355, partial [Acutalibacteraceae bacterium]|nr:hypothetical protein [Acutalibacteraceae bacterium]
ETLYFNNLEIAVHADINDKGQTVTFDTPDKITTATEPSTTTTNITGGKISTDITSDTVSTGDITKMYALLASAVSVLSLFVIAVCKRKTEKNEK